MNSHPWQSRRAAGSRAAVFVVIAGLLVALLSFATQSDSVAQDCPDGSVLSENGVTCELEVAQDAPICPEGQQLNAAGLLCEPIPEDPTSICPEGQELDAAGLLCVAIDETEAGSPCPAGEELDGAGLVCVAAEDAEDEAPATNQCDAGYSLGRDGETCIADGPACDRDQVLNDDGECVNTFRCPDGLILASDLLSCISDRCPDGELLSVDGKRCVAPDSDCPDGSPRPVGGACLVVETVEGDDGETTVVVRCAEADAFCQARIKRCADDRATGTSEEDAECADPREACDPEDEACAESNERLIECATRDEAGEDGEPVAIGPRRRSLRRSLPRASSARSVWRMCRVSRPPTSLRNLRHRAGGDHDEFRARRLLLPCWPRPVRDSG